MLLDSFLRVLKTSLKIKLEYRGRGEVHHQQLPLCLHLLYLEHVGVCQEERELCRMFILFLCQIMFPSVSSDGIE